jgi:peptide-methionine (S)-S-oxide reductase
MIRTHSLTRASRAALTAALLCLMAGASAAATAAKPDAKPAAPAKTTHTELATFAMGCFWCGETQFESLPGVKSVISGYAGGPEERPTYEQVSAGKTGHYESIQITFDPAVVSYAKLLDMFWHGIDPTQANGQFCDHGRQYRSAVFVHDATQKKLADDSRRAIGASGVLKQPIVTEILPWAKFWPAEEYHQDFWKKDPDRYTSYREGCGRDRRLAELWGAKAAKPLVH